MKSNQNKNEDFMMKGIKVLAMMLALTLGLAACGGSSSDTSSATSTENSVELSQTESTVSEETAEKGEFKTLDWERIREEFFAYAAPRLFRD